MGADAKDAEAGGPGVEKAGVAPYAGDDVAYAGDAAA